MTRMVPRILIIEADRAFARDLASPLHRRGAETRLCTDGLNGLEEARTWRPDLVVLCVELPNLSGYSVCNKLKKDEQLKPIPLILTSAEATRDTFEQHKKLRTRAEEYLLKPFEPATLVKAIEGLVQLQPESTSAPAVEGLGDDDLALIDRVFDELATGGVGDAGAPDGTIAIPPVTVVARVSEPGGAEDALSNDVVRARIVELETEVARLQAALQEANAERARLQALESSMQETIESSRAAVERASAAEARLGVIEQRLRNADALREKARRALTVVLQALEEPPQRASPVEAPPRRE
jgi:CheY-like chemotaxis protein